ncbi:MAG: glycosyltransferase family 4 protein [Gemmatimonadota bacterium]|nr:glycosyltransferase family 4 protein [Gemmatimonadota bacterium]
MTVKGPASRGLRVLKIAACPFPWPRGTPIRIRRLAESLSRAGHTVHVATYHLGQRNEPLPGVRVHRIADVPGYSHTGPGPTAGKLFRLDPRLRRLTARLVRAYPFDIIHAHHYEGLWAAMGARSLPVVYDAHTTLSGELPYYSLPVPRRVIQAVGRWGDAYLPRKADAVVAVSESIRQQLEGLGAARDIEVIPNGVDWAYFADLEGPPASDEVVMFTGNLAPYQGVELLLEAFAFVLERRPDARLAIVTDASFAPYRPLAERLGIHGAVDVIRAPFEQQPDLLRRARVTVSPRVECDGIPQKLLNYMASGTPVVAFEGSAAHVVNGETGRRVPNGDVAAMGTAIADLLGSPEDAARLGAAARSEVRASYTWDQMSQRVAGVYERVLAKREGPAASSSGG